MITKITRRYRFLQLLGNQGFLLALLIQGVGGCIQLKAYISTVGVTYLQYQANFTIGAIVATVIGLNTANLILAGKFTRSSLKMFFILSLVGFIDSISSMIYRSDDVPGYIAFTCWFLTSRLLLSMGKLTNVPSFICITLGLSFIVLFLSPIKLNLLLGSGFLVLVLASAAMFRSFLEHDDGILSLLKESAISYAKYAPHTVMGICIGYLDRGLALNTLSPIDAEYYLRAVQLCSMAAFVIYPIIIVSRNTLLGIRLRITPVHLSYVLIVIAAFLSIALGLVIYGFHYTGHVASLDSSLLVALFFWILLSQYYQSVSPLNFVNEQYQGINLTTCASMFVAIVGSAFYFMFFRHALSLALVTLCTWFTQSFLTSYYVLRQYERGSVCPRVSVTAPD